MMTMKQIAAQIRNDIKAKGIAPRDVSVRVDGSTIRVTLKRLGLPMADIEKLAMRHSVIHRDAASGEILQGGNTFIDVSYDADAMRPLRLAASDLLLPLTEGSSVEAGPLRVMLGNGRYDIRRIDGARLSSTSGWVLIAYSVDSAAHQVANLLAALGHTSVESR